MKKILNIFNAINHKINFCDKERNIFYALLLIPLLCVYMMLKIYEIKGVLESVSLVLLVGISLDYLLKSAR